MVLICLLLLTSITMITKLLLLQASQMIARLTITSSSLRWAITTAVSFTTSVLTVPTGRRVLTLAIVVALTTCTSAVVACT